MTEREYRALWVATVLMLHVERRRKMRDLCAEYGVPESVINSPRWPRPVRLEPHETQFDARLARRDRLDVMSMRLFPPHLPTSAIIVNAT